MSNLKIIAGEYKGRSLITPKNDISVRPILARIKKSLFDILTPKIVSSNFLDLFSGTGAVGIEALSRGAGLVVFIEGEFKCVKIINENLKKLNALARAKVEKGDITKGLNWLSDKFDIIFMGPPYKNIQKKPLALTGLTLKLIIEADLLQPKGVIVSQRHIKEPVVAPESLLEFRKERYGDSVLTFYRYGPEKHD